MISEDFAFFGFDEASWERLVSLLVPGRGGAARGVLVLVVDAGGTPVAAFHTLRGSFDPGTLPALDDLASLCDATDAAACIVMREQAMAELEGYLAEPLDRSQDFVAGVMRFVRVLRELGNGNWLRVWPNPLPDKLLSTVPATKPLREYLLPDGTNVLLGVFDRGELWTGAVIRRQGGNLDVFAGPCAISDWSGALGGAWRRDHRVLVQAVEQKLGPIHLGLFMERATAEKLFAGQQGGDWALAYATRDLIVHPIPGYAAAGLGLDVLGGAAQFAVQALGQMEPEEMAQIAKGFWRGLTDGRGVEGLLGFSPAALISTTLQKTLSERPPRGTSGHPREIGVENEAEPSSNGSGEPPIT